VEGDTATGHPYSGVDNLEAMTEAVNYRRFLVDQVVAVAGRPRPGLRILDFGSGTGTYAADVRADGYDVACVEIDPDLRHRLVEQGLVAYPTLDDLPGDGFPVAYTFNVLEHIEDHRAAVAGLYRAVQPGGTLIVYVPAFPVLYSAMDHKVGHFRRYRRAGLEQVVTGAGFVVRRCVHVDSLGFFAALAYRAIGDRDGGLDPRSVRLYDRYAFPVSRAVDRAAGPLFGKNLLLVAERPAA
jgi:SAM-dependent methyltransferase